MLGLAHGRAQNSTWNLVPSVVAAAVRDAVQATAATIAAARPWQCIVRGLNTHKLLHPYVGSPARPDLGRNLFVSTIVAKAW